MSRVALLLFMLFASFMLTSASPIPSNTAESLDKRITHSGRGTWFDVGLGNCGRTNINSDPVVAIAKSRYDASNGGNCGQWVRITNTANGNVAYGITEDSCPSCADGDLDMSPSLFEQLASLDVGVVQIQWNFMAKGWSP